MLKLDDAVNNLACEMIKQRDEVVEDTILEYLVDKHNLLVKTDYSGRQIYSFDGKDIFSVEYKLEDDNVNLILNKIWKEK